MNALEQFTPLMDAVISHIHDGVILTDYTGKVLFHNPVADELLGFPRFDSVSAIEKSTGFDLRKSLTPSEDTGLHTGRTLINKHRFEQRITRDGKTDRKSVV